jgi:hypothetical protein
MTTKPLLQQINVSTVQNSCSYRRSHFVRYFFDWISDGLFIHAKSFDWISDGFIHATSLDWISNGVFIHAKNFDWISDVVLVHGNSFNWMRNSADPKKHFDMLGSNVISCNLFYDRTCPMRVPTSPHRFSENVVSNRLNRSLFLLLCSLLRRILVLLSNIRISNKMLPKFEILDTKIFEYVFRIFGIVLDIN